MTGPAHEVAVVLAAHGDRAGASPNATLLGIRDQLRARGLFRVVTAGVLKGEPGIEDALSEAATSGARRIVVYPLFMADGYFTRMVLPQRISECGLGSETQLLAPLGLDPNLPAVMMVQATRAATEAGFSPKNSTLLVVGHGSKFGPASADATRRAAAAVECAQAFRSVAVALLEEPPLLGDVLAAAQDPVVVIGFFSGDGLHAGEDVPNALKGVSVPAVYAGSVGQSPAIAGLISDAVLTACACEPPSRA